MTRALDERHHGCKRLVPWVNGLVNRARLISPSRNSSLACINCMPDYVTATALLLALPTLY